MRRAVLWIVVVVVVAAAPLLRAHFTHRSDALLMGFVSICPGDTRDHVVTIMGAPTLEARANLHMAADYELRYKVWLPWPNEWVVAFRGDVVVGMAFVPFPRNSLD
jgi:hypothetical protein